MAVSLERSKQKVSGSKYNKYRAKRKKALGRETTLTRIGEIKSKIIRTLGGNKKTRIMQTNIANVLNQKTKKSEKSEIIGVVENKASRHYVRMNVITKGAVIETKAGLAQVTNRPGQEGVVNAVLIEKTVETKKKKTKKRVKKK